MTALEVIEQGAQSLVDRLLPQERPEGHKPRGIGQRGVRWALTQAARVRAADALALFLELVALSPLASQLISAHLLGARRGLLLCCHRNQHNYHAGRSFFDGKVEFLSGQPMGNSPGGLPPSAKSRLSIEEGRGVRKRNCVRQCP